MKNNKGILKNILFCFLNLLLFMVVQMVVMSLFVMALPNAMPNMQIVAMAVFNLLYLACIFLIFRLKKKNIWQKLNVLKVPISSSVLAFFIGLLFSFGYDMGMAAFASPALQSSMEQQVEMGFGMGVPMAVLVMVLLQPVSEEVLFRGLIMKRLANNMPQPVALLISALLFGALHVVAGLYLVPITFLGGLLFGYIFYKSRSLVGAILAHAGANASGILEKFLPNAKGGNVIVCVLSLAICAVMLYAFSRNFKGESQKG